MPFPFREPIDANPGAPGYLKNGTLGYLALSLSGQTALKFAPNRLSIWARIYRDRQHVRFPKWKMENGRWKMENAFPSSVLSSLCPCCFGPTEGMLEAGYCALDGLSRQGERKPEVPRRAETAPGNG